MNIERFNPHNAEEYIRLAGDEWADADAKATSLEEHRKTLHSELSLTFIDAKKSNAEAEKRAYASPQYRLHLDGMIEARRLANRAKAKLDARKIQAEVWRTEQANVRQEKKSGF